MPGFSSSASAPADERITAAAQTLARGGIVVFPTETLYGLGVDALNATALQRVVRLKGRDAQKPIAVLVSDRQMLANLVTEIPPLAETLMERFWPGPLTIVFGARPMVSSMLTGGQGSIGVRVSSHPMATVLVQTLGRPVTAPSANPAGMPPPVTVDEARGYFGGGVDAYVDGGRLRGAPASTVVDVRGRLQIVREGAIGAADLYASLRRRAVSW
jgi:L-threonylcarbamoyladenylate synthase